MCNSLLKTVLVSFLALILATDVLAEKVEVLTERSFVREDGYDFEFKTSDGSSRKEEGALITVGEHQGIGVRGSYSFMTPDGQQYLVTFEADDKGYRPKLQTLNSGQ